MVTSASRRVRCERSERKTAVPHRARTPHSAEPASERPGEMGFLGETGRELVARGPADTRRLPQRERRQTDERLGQGKKEERRSREDGAGRVKHRPSLFRSNCSHG